MPHSLGSGSSKEARSNSCGRGVWVRFWFYETERGGEREREEGRGREEGRVGRERERERGRKGKRVWGVPSADAFRGRGGGTPLSSRPGTYKTVTARFWPWFGRVGYRGTSLIRNCPPPRTTVGP